MPGSASYCGIWREKVAKPHSWGATTSTSNSQRTFVDSIASPRNRTVIPNIWHVLRFLPFSSKRARGVCEPCKLPAEGPFDANSPFSPVDRFRLLTGPFGPGCQVVGNATITLYGAFVCMTKCNLHQPLTALPWMWLALHAWSIQEGYPQCSIDALRVCLKHFPISATNQARCGDPSASHVPDPFLGAQRAAFSVWRVRTKPLARRTRSRGGLKRAVRYGGHRKEIL